MQGIESFCQYLVKFQQCRRIVSRKKCIHQRETVFIIQDIKVTKHILIFHLSAAESYSLVEYCQSVTHSSVSLMRYDMK